MALVLVVDDDANIRLLLREELTYAGHSVVCAADGEAGMEAAARECPDVVVLDVKMPGLDGIEVLRRLKRACGDVRVLLFTAYDDHRREAAALGADGYVVKSYDLSRLTEEVALVLARPPTRPATTPPRSA